MTKHRVRYQRFAEDDINAPEMTLDEIAKALGLSSARCGDIYRAAMRKVKLRMISLGLDGDMRDIVRDALSK